LTIGLLTTVYARAAQLNVSLGRARNSRMFHSAHKMGVFLLTPRDLLAQNTHGYLSSSYLFHRMLPIDIYAKILKIVEYFLNNAVHLTVQELQGYNPSVAQLAKDIRKAANLLRALSSSSYEDEAMAINALQCFYEMDKLAKVVETEDDAGLEEIFRRLDAHIKAPIPTH
jgi:hypothetical protein